MSASAVYFGYRDATAAVRWLKAVGFRVLAQQRGEDGTLVHAELGREDLVVMLGEDDSGFGVPELAGASTGVGVCLVTDDVDGLFERAVAAGGSAVLTPEDTGWGGRRARVLDPEGREWSFGDYRPGS
ncbi:VOC family protein [Leifsonia sp. NPDC080035]|uniref:VOC family protein n=1 Tax=Leifsonia sp. NPDC080035 TaxID=3143936 RepID=A0AAU7G7P0_9MICO